MGLAGPRKRTKISHDPNNTSWSRSTEGYGHKIMTSQGWAPGNFLGASDSNRTDTYTPASASHIRVTLKDDTLGLGAKPRRPLVDDEPTGLDAFQGLLGRLNGKSDVELEKEQRVMDNIKVANYIESRWKCMNFVSGGLLAQEKQNDTADKKEEDPAKLRSEKKERKEKEKREKKEKKEKKEKRKDESKDKKKKRKKDRSESMDDSESAVTTKSASKSRSTSTDGTDDEQTDDSDLARKHKKKSKKRKRKEDEAERLKAKSSSSSPDKVEPSEEANDKPSKAGNVVTTKERIPMGRQLLRGRYIQQKKRALMDVKSLNEIFMTAS